ncbi:MAG: hypothetical protein WEH44_03825 [Pirellulaceae bacterium]
MLEKLEAPIDLVKNCEIEPPDWSSVHPNYPPDNSTPHEVHEGENWISIANVPKHSAALLKYREHVPPHLIDGLSEEMANARSLIYFNYGTTVPEYVNWYLLNVNCCYHATTERTNRRFSNYDKDVKSPRYGKVKRAGKVYIPTEKVKPPPKTLPDVRKVHFWARMAFQDNIIKYLKELAGIGSGASTAEKLLEGLEEVLKRRGIDWDPQQLRKLAKLRKFARPLRHALKALKIAGWAATAVELILGGRVVTGYLVMTYEDPFDTHVAWEVDMILKGKGFFTDDSGAFTTHKDTYDIRTSVFDPEHQWKEKKLSATMTGGSLGLSVLEAFRSVPYAKDPSKRAFGGHRFVIGRPGARDWTLSLKSMHSLGGGVAFFHTVPGLAAHIRNGRQRTFTKIMDV